MIPFMMVMFNVFMNSVTKMSLADRDDSIQTFILYRANESLTISIQIGTLGHSYALPHKYLSLVLFYVLLQMLIDPGHYH